MSYQLYYWTLSVYHLLYGIEVFQWWLMGSCDSSIFIHITCNYICPAEYLQESSSAQQQLGEPHAVISCSPVWVKTSVHKQTQRLTQPSPNIFSWLDLPDFSVSHFYPHCTQLSPLLMKVLSVISLSPAHAMNLLRPVLALPGLCCLPGSPQLS